MKATGGLYQVFFATIVFGLNGYFIANVCGGGSSNNDEGAFADLPPPPLPPHLYNGNGNNNNHFNYTHLGKGPNIHLLMYNTCMNKQFYV